MIVMLSVIRLTRRGEHVARNVNAAHGLISDAVGREHCLWAQPNPNVIVVRSAREPAKITGYMNEVVSYEEQEPPAQFQFSLIGHTIRRNNQKEIILRDDTELHDWLIRRVGDAFRVDSVEYKQLPHRRGSRWDMPITLAATQFHGQATLISRPELHRLLHHGVGRGKAYGFGLLIASRV